MGKKKILLDRIIAEHRGKYVYDCIIPFSGGKDSVFQVYYLMKEYKIKPLLVRFNHGFIRKTIQENVDKILKKLGVDFIDFTPNWKIVKKVMLESFKRKNRFLLALSYGYLLISNKISSYAQSTFNILWGTSSRV